VTATVLTVRATHLDHLHLVSGDEPGQPRTPRAGALNTDRAQLPVAGQPGVQCLVPGGGCRERLGADQSAELVERGGYVEVLVGVDPAGNHPRCICHR